MEESLYEEEINSEKGIDWEWPVTPVSAGVFWVAGSCVTSGGKIES